MGDLIASFLWGTIGLGFFLYGKKAAELVPLVVGLLMMVLSYFFGAIWLTLASILLLAVLWMWYRGNLG